MDPNLYKAAMHGDAQFVRDKAGDEGYDLLARTPQENTALHVAARFGHVDFAREIISIRPTSLDLTNEEGDTPLHVAARAGFTSLVQLLADEYLERARQSSGPDEEHGRSSPPIRMLNNASNTALHEALRNRHRRAARILLRADDGIASFANNNGESPLYLAAEMGLLGIVRSILRQQSGISQQGPDGKTPLHAAAMRGRIKTAKLLLEEDPQLDIRKADDLGRTALHYAAAERRVAISRLLLKRDHALARVTDNDGLSPLHVATRYRHRKIADIILAHCPDCFEIRDRKGRNALHYAASEPLMTKYFLRRPESMGLLNQADGDGNTPLHLAATCYHYHNAKRLIRSKGVDLNAKNQAGSTAVDICEQAWDVSIKKIHIWDALRQSGAVRGREEFEGRLPVSMRHPVSHPKADLTSAASSLSVVAALFATVSCAAAFTVPGGYKSDGPHEGLAVLARKTAFRAFMVSDAVTLCASLAAAYALNWASWDDASVLRNTLAWGQKLVKAALYGVCVAFATGTYAVLSREDQGLAITVIVLSCIAPLVIRFLFRSISTKTPAFSPKGVSRYRALRRRVRESCLEVENKHPNQLVQSCCSSFSSVL